MQNPGSWFEFRDFEFVAVRRGQPLIPRITYVAHTFHGSPAFVFLGIPVHVPANPLLELSKVKGQTLSYLYSTTQSILEHILQNQAPPAAPLVHYRAFNNEKIEIKIQMDPRMSSLVYGYMGKSIVGSVNFGVTLIRCQNLARSHLQIPSPVSCMKDLCINLQCFIVVGVSSTILPPK